MNIQGRLANSTNQQTLSSFSKAKREQIVRGAIDVFLRYGYEGTSMSRVAQAAGVIKQTIYSHFHDKEGLFIAIVENLTFHHLEAQFGSHFDFKEKPQVVLRRLGDVFIGRQQDSQYIALMRTVIGESNRFPELTRLYTKTVIQRGIQLLTQYFNAHPELNLKDAEAASRIFCGSIVNHILLQEILYGKEIVPFDADRVIEQLIAFVLKDTSDRK